MQAKVVKVIGGLYDIYDYENDIIYKNIKAKGILRSKDLDKKSSFLKSNTYKVKVENKNIKLSPKVGDNILFEIKNNIPIISDIMPRKNELVRPPLANIDKMLVIFSAKEPSISFNLLDKFLIILEKNHITPIIIITKIDLATKAELDNLKSDLGYYEKIGYNIVYTSNLDKKNIKLDELFKNQTIGIMGQTGVGKTSFLNSINPSFDFKTQEISKALGRGKHTTRHNELHKFLGGFISDTPGFSKLDIDILYKDELKNYYPDFLVLSSSCKLKSKCTHIQEPGCMVFNEYEKGNILYSRYLNYKNIFNEIKNKKRKY